MYIGPGDLYVSEADGPPTQYGSSPKMLATSTRVIRRASVSSASDGDHDSGVMTVPAGNTPGLRRGPP